MIKFMQNANVQNCESAKRSPCFYNDVCSDRFDYRGLSLAPESCLSNNSINLIIGFIWDRVPCLFVQFEKLYDPVSLPELLVLPERDRITLYHLNLPSKLPLSHEVVIMGTALLFFVLALASVGPNV